MQVPIYAVDSWFALRFPDINIYFDVARETYEAYVIYNFYVYLLAFLRQRRDFDIDIHKRDNHPHMFPCCCLKYEAGRGRRERSREVERGRERSREREVERSREREVKRETRCRVANQRKRRKECDQKKRQDAFDFTEQRQTLK